VSYDGGSEAAHVEGEGALAQSLELEARRAWRERLP
jgi:hypothetical protein